MAINPETYAQADEYGNDPLSHKLLKQLNSITSYTSHTVVDAEVGNPQLIAFDYYKDVELFFIILAYNGIANGLSIKAGDSLKIPALSQITNLTRKKTQTVTI